ncbi:MAG: class I SAM-dependent methyltransferase [Algicola sp.]|nr:class I SAM-dependent methyltransferase [Algicola sp.]
MLKTHPQPSAQELPLYYQSEDYISHTDAKRNWFEKIYQYVKSIALKRKLKLINSFDLESQKLLDIGCGTGDFLKIAQAHGWDVFGIEPNQDARDLANAKTGAVVFDTLEVSQFKESSFDVITLWHVLEHLPNLENQIKAFEKLLKPKGSLIIAVPNFKSYDARYYKTHWAAYDVPRHLWHFSRTAISKLMQMHKMEVIKTLPMIFDAFYVSLLSEKYKTGFMNPVKAFWNGMVSNFKAKRNGEHSSLIYIIKKT